MQANRLLRLPRMPFAPKLDKTTRQPSTPTLESLNQPMIPAKKYPYFYPKKDLAPHIRLSQPKKEKRYLTQVETARPLPDTFPATKSFKDYKQKPLMCEPLPEGEYHYPYRYYEICLRRGLIGLPKKTREISGRQTGEPIFLVVTIHGGPIIDHVKSSVPAPNRQAEFATLSKRTHQGE